MLRTNFTFFAACAVTSAVLASGEGRAADADFYKGNTVTIIVGFAPGGGNDLYARLLARHIGKHIPGNPTVIVQNMPGAGSLTAVKHLDGNAPQDGTVITTFQSGTITESVVAPEKSGVNFRNYAWVGVANGEVRVCYGFGPNAVKSWDDLMSRKEFVLGTSAKGNAAYINGATMRQVFGAPVKQVLGYPGANDQRLAIERGELDGSCGSYTSIPDDWIRDKKAHVFVRFSETRPAEIPESATFIGNYAKTNEQKQLLTLLSATDELGRTFIMSKAVPAARIKIIQQAFDATMKDKDFLAEAGKQQLPISPLTGDQVEKMVSAMLSASPKVIADAKSIYE